MIGPIYNLLLFTPSFAGRIKFVHFCPPYQPRKNTINTAHAGEVVGGGVEVVPGADVGVNGGLGIDGYGGVEHLTTFLVAASVAVIVVVPTVYFV
jgi:hypothetical protein